ncbi:hypothetical protein FRC09_000806 [Ceratobasidium sp. 395]|nr:hypothetical protein FRC09_000806 [Ceratobasidium sp. 395]
MSSEASSDSSEPPAEIIEHLTEHGCRDLTDDLDPSSFSAQPVSHGGYGYVYREKLRDGRQVAIKALRVPLNDDDEADQLPKRAARELYTWSKCQHPNVLPLLGLALFQDQIRMVSSWAENGSLPSYLEEHPGTDRCDMNNVLVSDQGVPVITDFGNAVLEQGTMQFTETVKQGGFTPRWTAPEILEDEVKQSRQADVYALGMVVAIKNETPKRPEESIPSNSLHGDALWLLLMSCWEQEPDKRPDADKVVEIVSLRVDRFSSKTDIGGLQMEGVTRDGLMPPQVVTEAEPEPESAEDRPGKRRRRE